MFDPYFSELEFYYEKLQLSVVKNEWLKIIEKEYQFDNKSITEESIVLSNNEFSLEVSLIRLSFSDRKISLSCMIKNKDESILSLIRKLHELTENDGIHMKKMLISGVYSRAKIEQQFNFNLEGLKCEGFNLNFKLLSNEGFEIEISVSTRERKKSLIVISEIEIESKLTKDVEERIEYFQQLLEKHTNSFLADQV